MLRCYPLRHHHCAHDDDDQHGRALVAAAHLVRQGHRHLPGHVLRLRVRRAARVRRRQLHLLGRQGQEEEKGEAGRRRSRGQKATGTAAATAAGPTLNTPIYLFQ